MRACARACDFCAACRNDGSIKLRAVDDFTRSGCNAATAPTEKLHYENLDYFVAALRAARAHLGDDLGLWKADIDSAYRRIPVAPEHRSFAWIAFLHKHRSAFAQHLCLPFGSVASVHHWDRIGALLRAIARRFLHLPVSRFVDDFFAMARAAEVEHSMQMFARSACVLYESLGASRFCVFLAARMVRCLLGASAIAEHKLEHGVPLTVLGISISLSSDGIRLRPEKAKIEKWSKQIQAALACKRLCAGEASKLAGMPFVPQPVSVVEIVVLFGEGRLMWASQYAFKRVGRAMLYPIFRCILFSGVLWARSASVFAVPGSSGQATAPSARSCGWLCVGGWKLCPTSCARRGHGCLSQLRPFTCL